MTNPILKPAVEICDIESNQQRKILQGLVKLVARSTRKIEKRHAQLEQIANEHFDVFIRLQAEEFLVNQSKMSSIALELKTRIIKTLEQSQSNLEELTQQYIDELDILNFMDFEITKKYFSFIHDHYQPKVIQLIPMAA